MTESDSCFVRTLPRYTLRQQQFASVHQVCCTRNTIQIDFQMRTSEYIHTVDYFFVTHPVLSVKNIFIVTSFHAMPQLLEVWSCRSHSDSHLQKVKYWSMVKHIHKGSKAHTWYSRDQLLCFFLELLLQSSEALDVQKLTEGLGAWKTGGNLYD